MNVTDYESPTAPPRSLQQRYTALARANKVRSHRKALKEDLKAGRRSAFDVLADPEEEVLTMKVFDLLLAMPKVGRVKANKWLNRCRVSPSKTISGLSQRQREELLRRLRLQVRMGGYTMPIPKRDLATFVDRGHVPQVLRRVG